MPTYLGAIIFGLPLWVLLFWWRRDLRHKMLMMSLLVSLLAVTDLFFVPEYWQPVVFLPVLGGKVDLLAFVFCFITGGVFSVLYEEIMGERDVHEPRKRNHPLKILVLSSPIAVLVLRLATSWNFMTIAVIALMVGIAIVVFSRRDLVGDIIYSGLLAAVVYGILLMLYLQIFPNVLNVWNFRTFPQFLVGNVPHMEIVWAFLTGAFLGPIYEFANDLAIRKITSRRAKKQRG